jgi:hypothetical protein
VEAGCEAGGEELFGIRAAGISTQFLGYPQIQVKAPSADRALPVARP